MRVVNALKRVETGGVEDCSRIKGASGETGCLQWLASTWNMWATEVLGYVPPMTPTNEYYVAAVKVSQWMEQGLSEAQIAGKWNTGRVGPCIRGINRHNVPYDSCEYERKVLAQLNR